MLVVTVKRPGCSARRRRSGNAWARCGSRFGTRATTPRWRCFVMPWARGTLNPLGPRARPCRSRRRSPTRSVAAANANVQPAGGNRSPPASVTSCDWSARGWPTTTSPPGFSFHDAPCKPTSPTSTPNSASPRACNSPRKQPATPDRHQQTPPRRSTSTTSTTTTAPRAKAPRKTSPGQQTALASYPTNTYDKPDGQNRIACSGVDPVWWKQGQAACAVQVSRFSNLKGPTPYRRAALGSGTAGQSGLGAGAVTAHGGQFTRNGLSGDGRVGGDQPADDGAGKEQHRTNLQ